MSRDITESQRFCTQPNIGTREVGEVVRGRKNGPERGQKDKRKFSSWGKEIPCQIVDVDPKTVFGNFDNG